MSPVALASTTARPPPAVPPTAPVVRRARRRPAANVLSTLLAGALVCISGNPVLSGAAAPVLLVLMLAGALALPAPRVNVRFSRRYLMLAGVLSAVFIGQWMRFGFVSWMACAYLLVKMLVGGFVIHRIGPSFPLRLLQAVSVLSAVALPAYGLLLVVGPERFPTLFPQAVLGENLKSVFFLTAHVTDEWWRNSGPMWEPGAYQGILNLALMLAPNRELLDPRRRLRLLLLVTALLTTFSTTGYIVLFVVVLSKILRSRTSSAFKLPFAALVVAVSAFVYLEADFLGQKIAEQVADKALQEDFTPDRFGALLFDLHYIQKSPWIGNGLHESTRFADHPWLQGEPLGHGNGLSNFAASMGLIALGAYLAGLATAGQVRGSLGDRVALVVLVTLLAFGEQFLLYPLFLGLPFLTGQARPRKRLTRREAARQRAPRAPEGGAAKPAVDVTTAHDPTLAGALSGAQSGPPCHGTT